MAGPFYVDIGSPAAWNGRTGLDGTTNCWLGISGLQKAFDTVSANEIVYIKGTGDLSKFFICPVDTVSGQFTQGEGIAWGSGGTAGTGVLLTAITTGGTSIELELLTGVHPADNVTITGATSTQTMLANDLADTGCIKKGIDVDTKTGAVATGMPKYIGCNSAFAIDGTRCIIDGAATTNVHGVVVAGTCDYLWFENIEIKRIAGTSKDGFSFTSSTSLGNVFINCCANNCSGYGFNFVESQNSLLFRCLAYSNTLAGFRRGGGFRFLYCASHSNSQDGFEMRSTTQDFIGCVSHGNSVQGFLYPETNEFIYNSVIDGNTLGACESNAATGLQIIIGSRITNHSGGSGFGLKCISKIFITGFNYFENNTGDNIQTATLHYYLPLEGGSSTSNLEDLSNAESGGYVDISEHDFSTGYVDSGDPDLRRTAITIPWT